MKQAITIIAIFCFWTSYSQADGSFTMTISSDTVLMGNTLQLQYSIKNLEGEFIAPDLSDFRVVSGPNVSSQFSSINGQVTQSSTYSYYLLPIQPGLGTIGAASIRGKEDINLEPANVIILDNPFGVQESYGSPLSLRNQVATDTLSTEQKELLKKLKTGKRRKI